MRANSRHLQLLRRLLATAAAMALLGALLGACGGTSSSSTQASATSASRGGSATSTTTTKAPYRVLFICPLSGPLAVAGAAEKDGLMAATAQINSQGGILGHRVVVTAMDDAATGTKAASDAETALSSSTPYNMVYGGCFGQDSIPIATAFGKSDTLTYGALPNNFLAPPKYPNVFNPGSLTTAPELAMATAMKAKGITKFAIITGDDATGQLGAQELTDAAKSLGMSVTATELVPDTAVDATPQMQAAIASHPQAIASNNYTPVIGPILKARTKLGSTLPLYGDAYFSAANLALVSTKAERAGVVEQAFPFLVRGTAAEKSPSWLAFVKYDSTYDPKPLISLYADMTTWDALMQARAAAIKAGTISGPAVSSALGEIAATSAVPGFVGGKELYLPSSHAWQLTPADYSYYPAGVSPGGLLTPSS